MLLHHQTGIGWHDDLHYKESGSSAVRPWLSWSMFCVKVAPTRFKAFVSTALFSTSERWIYLSPSSILCSLEGIKLHIQDKNYWVYLLRNNFHRMIRRWNHLLAYSLCRSSSTRAMSSTSCQGDELMECKMVLTHILSQPDAGFTIFTPWQPPDQEHDLTCYWFAGINYHVQNIRSVLQNQWLCNMNGLLSY